MSTETQPSIAELWGQFYPYAAGILSFWGTVSDAHPDKARAEALRTQLIERCTELVDCIDGHFCISHKLILRISHGQIDAFKEASAIFAFWAWELEQRQKEATPPQVIP